MEIQNISMGLSLHKTKLQAALQVQSMALNTARGESEMLQRILESAKVFGDPNLGRFVDLIV